MLLYLAYLHVAQVEEGSHAEIMKIPIKKDEDGQIIQGFYHNQWDTREKHPRIPMRASIFSIGSVLPSI